MRTSIVFAAVFLMLSLFACKRINNQPVIVIKDCTGEYLRYNTRDYKVCNTEALRSYQDGQYAIATFEEITECSGSGSTGFNCQMLHNYESWIEVNIIE